ncbi:MAG: substrate-binding domain-containing protein [Mycobacterium sp.]
MTHLTLFSTLAVRKALDDFVIDAFTQRTGTAITAVFDPTNALLRRIETGEGFDVLIGVTSSFDKLGKAGVVDLFTRVAIARTGIGLAVGPGAPLPRIDTADALLESLLNARSVAYSRTGASGIYFAELLTRLGIAEEVNSRATILEKGFTAEALLDGRADIAIQQLSELLFVPDARIAGPLPADVQHYTEFSAVVAARASRSATALALRDFLAEPASRDAYRRARLEDASG